MRRRAEDRELLTHAAEQLLTSEGWQRWVWVRARGGLARLSLNNQLLVALAALVVACTIVLLRTLASEGDVDEGH